MRPTRATPARFAQRRTTSETAAPQPRTNVGLVESDEAPHIDRLDRSLRELRMAWPCSKDELKAMHLEMVKRNALKEGIIYMQVTRGVARRDHAFPADAPKPSRLAHNVSRWDVAW